MDTSEFRNVGHPGLIALFVYGPPLSRKRFVLTTCHILLPPYR